MAGNRDKALSVLGTACLVLCVVCGISLFRRRAELRSAAETYDKIRSGSVLAEAEGAVAPAVDEERLRGINPDYVFWLEIPGTEISYPVVQAENNSDYLRVSFTGKPFIGGCIFVDAACPADLSGRNTVIYGHRMPDGTMFTGLEGYLKEDFAREHGELRIHIGRERRIFRLFAVLREDAQEDYARTTFADGGAFRCWLDDQRSRALTDTRLEITEDTHAVTLVTCAGDGSERLAVIWIPEE